MNINLLKTLFFKVNLKGIYDFYAKCVIFQFNPTFQSAFFGVAFCGDAFPPGNFFKFLRLHYHMAEELTPLLSN